MAIKYRVAFSRNPRTLKEGFHAAPVYTPTDVVAPAELARRIAERLGSTPESVDAVLAQLAQVVRLEVTAGRMVLVPGLGRFRIRIQTRWVPTAEAFRLREHLIAGRIRFRAERSLRDLEAKLEFVLYDGAPARPLDGPSDGRSQETAPPEGDGEAA